MSKIVFKPPFDENKSFDKVAGVADNTATTKLLSAQPSRHTLAIFMPNATCALSVFITSLLDAYISKLSAVYDGLIGVNTRPKGNSPSRIVAVVETHHLIYRVIKLTKLLGVFTMNTKHTPRSLPKAIPPILHYLPLLAKSSPHKHASHQTKTHSSLIISW